jgi:hypothetical protein
MKSLLILLLLAVGTSSCADPTRLITNKPKSNDEKQKEREQRRQDDKAATEALKNFKITDHAGKKTKQTISKEESQPSSKDSQSKPAENAPQTFSTQPEKK